MSRKNTFTATEIDEIKRLINKKVVASKDEQKRIRDRIRDIGFYFSDYSSKKGYTVADLDELIRNGAIKVVGGNYKSTVPTVTKQVVQRPTPTPSVWTTPTSHSKKSLAPIVWDNTEILILGTMPGDRSLELGEYYAHPRNRFWKIIATITDDEVPTTYDEKKSLLRRYKIGLWDVAKAADRKGSLDADIFDAVPNDLDEFLKTYKNIKVIGFNGSKAMELFAINFQRQDKHRHVALKSTSPANTTINFEQICNDWRRIF
jgi:hypoxanthine-DNA glycosylase